MPLTEQKLERLDELLLLMPDETMPLSALDGFLTALILSPEEIPVSEWLPVVWGEAEANLFQQADIMKEASGLLMAHFNGLGAQLENPRHEIDPEFTYIDVPEHEGIIWESWVSGFFHAVALRQGAWDAAIGSAEEEASSCFAILRALESVSSEDCALPQETQDWLIESAPSLIPFSVTGLNKWRLSRRQGYDRTPLRLHAKTGRNDPCPCGSGKKFKKCCGAA